MSVLEKTKNPSLFGVAFFSILMALVGASFGFTLLASIPPERYESVADYKSDAEEDPKKKLLDAYYFRGPKPSGNGWMLKRETLLNASNTSVLLTDSEINAWIANKFQKSQISFSDKENPDVLIIQGLPNFFIDPTEGIHFSMMLEILVFGKEINQLLIGKMNFSGEYENSFYLRELRLNEARIPLSEERYDYLLNTLLKPFYENEEFALLRKALEKVSSVEFVENGIRLHLD